MINDNIRINRRVALDDDDNFWQLRPPASCSLPSYHHCQSNNLPHAASNLYLDLQPTAPTIDMNADSDTKFYLGLLRPPMARIKQPDATGCPVCRHKCAVIAVGASLAFRICGRLDLKPCHSPRSVISKIPMQHETAAINISRWVGWNNKRSEIFPPSDLACLGSLWRRRLFVACLVNVASHLPAPSGHSEWRRTYNSTTTSTLQRRPSTPCMHHGLEEWMTGKPQAPKHPSTQAP